MVQSTEGGVNGFVSLSEDVLPYCSPAAFRRYIAGGVISRLRNVTRGASIVAEENCLIGRAAEFVCCCSVESEPEPAMPGDILS